MGFFVQEAVMDKGIVQVDSYKDGVYFHMDTAPYIPHMDTHDIHALVETLLEANEDSLEMAGKLTHKKESLHLYSVVFMCKDGEKEEEQWETQLVSATNFFDAERWVKELAEKMTAMGNGRVYTALSPAMVNSVPNATDNRTFKVKTRY
jgi:hypothetical protein